MINLLPPDIKEGYVYAQRNTRIRRWAIAFVVGLVGVGVITSAGMFYMQGSINDYTKKVATAQNTLKQQKLGQVQKQVQDLTSSLKLVTQVLSKEILFSKLIQQVGAAMPANTSLNGLSINKVQGGIDLTASAVNYTAATQVQVNLSDPQNKIFTQADIVSISCTNGNSGNSNSAQDTTYPCTVTIRALFAKNNPYLFINNTKARS